jgi:hypothetical protein
VATLGVPVVRARARARSIAAAMIACLRDRSSLTGSVSSCASLCSAICT